MADYLLDTNVLILHLRRNPDITTLLAELSDSGVLYVSVLTRTEVLAGMHAHEEARTLELLDALALLPADAAVADRAGRLIYRNARQGTRLSFADALIGATALQHNLTLVTANARHFPLPELRVEVVG